MTTVVLPDAQRFDLAQELLRPIPATAASQVHPDRREISTTDTRLGRLLERINDAPWVILPYFGKENDHWLLAASSPLLLDKVRTRLVRFLTPSYGCFFEGNPTVKAFDPAASDLQRLAAPLYPAGYYRWQSRVKYRSLILDRLILWLDLEAGEPRLEQEVAYTYHQLQKAFEEALAEHRWEQSTWALAELGRRHLATAENLLFLRLQLLAAQGEWAAIWENAAFETWSELAVPRGVRTILLRACYEQTLRPKELQEAWQDGLEVFGRVRPRLGRLLSGPFEFDEPAVARLVAYQVVADQDASRLALLEPSALDAQSAFILQKLCALQPPIPPTPQPISVLDQAIGALAQQDYAAAEKIIPNLDEPNNRAVLFLELAFHTQDEQIAQRAWGSYQSLTFAEQEVLSGHARFVAEYLVSLKDRMLPATSQPVDLGQSSGQSPAERGAHQPQALRTWQAIGLLERNLRTLIGTRYQANFAQDWEQKLHTDPVLLARWNDMRNRDLRTFRQHNMPVAPLVDYTYLEDLSGMILRQWALFQDVFGQEKTARVVLADKITAINRVRNPLAHNRTVPENELIRAETYCHEIMKHLSTG